MIFMLFKNVKYRTFVKNKILNEFKLKFIKEIMD